MKFTAVRISAALLVAALIALVAGHSPQPEAQAQPPRRQRPPEPPPAKPTVNIIRQGFPAAQADSSDLTKSESAWEIEWELSHPHNRPMTPPGCVLRIKTAKFMWKDRAGKPQWVTVVRNLEIGEIYVPYDNGWTAFLDIHDMPFHITRARKDYLGPSCVRPGELVPSDNPAWNHTIHKEVHDDGIRWMSAETDSRNEVADRARRGEKMILWSTYYGANYRYLMEYTFHDDGMLGCRIGPTGRNIFDRQDDMRDTHLHIGCWRFEPDLGDPVNKVGGPKDNEIVLVRHLLDESTDKFGVVAKPFNRNPRGEACEGSARWAPEDFTIVRMQSKARKNAHGRPISYDLITQRVGALRSLQPEGGAYDSNMDWVNYDFWVTRTEPQNTSYIDVAQYASQKRPLTGQPTTIWHCAPVLHTARSEDFGPENGKNSYTGLAVTFYTGFYLKPRDLFDSTPLYQAPAPRRPFRYLSVNP